MDASLATPDRAGDRRASRADKSKRYRIEASRLSPSKRCVAERVPIEVDLDEATEDGRARVSTTTPCMDFMHIIEMFEIDHVQ